MFNDETKIFKVRTVRDELESMIATKIKAQKDESHFLSSDVGNSLAALDLAHQDTE